MGRPGKEEAKLQKQRESMGVNDAKRILSDGPTELQITAARRFVDAGAGTSEIKALVEHENLGVKLLAIRALSKHEGLSENERNAWNDAWEEEMRRMLRDKLHRKGAPSGKSF